MDSKEQAKLRRWWKKWSPIFVVVAAAVWTTVTALAAGAWSVYQFRESSQQFLTKLEFDRAEAEKVRATALAEAERVRAAALLDAEKKRSEEQKVRDQTRADAEKDAIVVRRIEAQKPFFEERLKSYLEVIRVASRLTDPELPLSSDEWRDNVRKFFQMRWGELEMVGDTGIRNAARLVAEQINIVANFPVADRHDLRWSVECLADELRFSLEHTWGLDRYAIRESILREQVSKTPNGCNESRSPPLRPRGMMEGPQGFRP